MVVTTGKTTRSIFLHGFMSLGDESEWSVKEACWVVDGEKGSFLASSSELYTVDWELFSCISSEAGKGMGGGIWV